MNGETNGNVCGRFGMCSTGIGVTLKLPPDGWGDDTMGMQEYDENYGCKRTTL